MADGSFAACLPEGDFIARVEAPLVSLPTLVSKATAENMTIAARSRATVMEPVPARTTPTGGLDTAHFLSAIPENVTIVALGEANHGSREFLELRRDISLQLARERGFRVVMIEAGYGEALELDRYVQGEDLDARKAVEKLGYWIWDTEEFLDVLDAFRAYNARVEKRDRIRLWGMDVQYTEGSIGAILSLSELSDAERVLIRRLGTGRGESWKDMSTADRSTIEVALSRIARERSGTVEALASLALRHRIEAISLPLAQQVSSRDEGMAEMVNAVSSIAPGGKVIIWAHNGHIARVPVDGYPVMGEKLEATKRAAYYPIALVQAAGRARAWDEANAIGVIPHEIPPVKNYQVEHLLMAVTNGKGGFVIPSLLPTYLQVWLSTPRYMREFGSTITQELTLYDAMKAFEAFGIVPFGSPTTPTPTGIRKAVH
jgi:erythromycin esterase